jgi:HEAT repeat protein
MSLIDLFRRKRSPAGVAKSAVDAAANQTLPPSSQPEAASGPAAARPGTCPSAARGNPVAARHEVKQAAEEPETVDTLLSDLTADDPEKRSNAAWLLGGGGFAKKLDFSDSRIVDALLIALKDADQEVRRSSARSLKFHLSRQSDPRIVEALTSTLSDKSNADRVHEDALDALKTHTNSSIVAFAIPFLAHSNRTVRLNAATLLGASKDASAVEPLIAALKEKAEPRIIIALAARGNSQILRQNM